MTLHRDDVAKVAAGLDLTQDLEERARAFAAANAIAMPGDVVTTRYASWKRDRHVSIVSVGAHLIADWSKERGFYLDFDMTYVAHRLRADGSSAEHVFESGICLNMLRTADGREWRDRATHSRNARWWNHCALSWRLAESRAHLIKENDHAQ